MHFKISESSVSFGTSGVRALVSELDSKTCYAFTTAFLKSIGSTSKIVIGHDLRPSSPAITAHVYQACNDNNVEVIYVGAAPTPAIAYIASQLGLPAIVITGSHIPFDRNGIKFYTAIGEITKAEENLILQSDVNIPDQLDEVILPVPDIQASLSFANRYTEFFPNDLCVGLRVGVYEHSSVARDLLKSLFESFGATVISLGRSNSFVPIDTEAVRQEDVESAREWVVKYNLDMLVSTDGDADRPLIADENGRWLRGDVVGALTAIALELDDVVVPVSCNSLIELSGYFKSVLRTKIGSPFVIEGMKSSSGKVGGFEANGGFLLGSDIVKDGKQLFALPTRDAVLPMLALLSLAKDKGMPLSGLISLLPDRFTASNRLQEIDSIKSNQLLTNIRSGTLPIHHVVPESLGLPVSECNIDGLRITFESSDIVHLRQSGNAPELRCYTESDTENKAHQLCEYVLHSLKNLL